MNYNIIEIDGKHYLELPCNPGTTVYTVGPRIELGPLGMEAHLRVFPLELDLVGLIRSYDDIGKTIFLTPEEAEAEIERLNEEARNEIYSRRQG